MFCIKLLKKIGLTMSENPEMAMMTFAVGGLLWIIMVIMAAKNQFHNKKVKIAWLVAMIFVPPTALLFPFIGMKHMK